MRLASAYREDVPRGVIMKDGVAAFLEDVNRALATSFPTSVGALIRRGADEALARVVHERGFPKEIAVDPLTLAYAAPYRNPPKIWGIGLNFQAHAKDLDSARSEDPGTFMRPASAITDPGATTTLPPGVGTVTGEGEIGVILRHAPLAGGEAATREAVWGFTPLLDLTAEAMLRRNVRYLTRAKSYPGFLAFGPWIVSRDEWEPAPATRVRTILNGATAREGTVAEMAHDPYALVAFESRTFAWEATDLLQTGTPGAVPLEHGDIIGADVAGLGRVTLRVTAAPQA